MSKIIMFLNKKVCNEKGISLPVVIMVFAVLSILFSSSVMVMQNNTLQIDSQEDNIRAYYVARSGIDIAYAALMQDNKENFNSLINGTDSSPDDLTITGLNVPQVDPIGTVDVDVSIVQNEATGHDEVKIHATSQILDDDESYTLSMYIKKDNTEKTRWERN